MCSESPKPLNSGYHFALDVVVNFMSLQQPIVFCRDKTHGRIVDALLVHLPVTLGGCFFGCPSPPFLTFPRHPTLPLGYAPVFVPRDCSRSTDLWLDRASVGTPTRFLFEVFWEKAKQVASAG
jgi:hypothetical protein